MSCAYKKVLKHSAIWTVANNTSKVFQKQPEHMKGSDKLQQNLETLQCAQELCKLLARS